MGIISELEVAGSEKPSFSVDCRDLGSGKTAFSLWTAALGNYLVQAVGFSGTPPPRADNALPSVASGVQTDVGSSTLVSHPDCCNLWVITVFLTLQSGA